MISKQSISNINAPSYSQAKTRLDLSNHPIFKTQEINNSSEEDFVSMDEATLIGNTLQAISPKINHLILDNNELGERTMEELVIIFKAIPQSILHLTIKANDLYDAGSKRNNKNISEIQAFENIVDALSKGYLSGFDM